MLSVELDINPQNLHYFDKFLSEGIVRPPVNSLRAGGSYDRSSGLYQRTYEVLIKKDGKEVVVNITLSATQDKVNPLEISTESTPLEHKFSEEEIEYLINLLISRIREAEKNTKEKLMKTFEYEARLSTSYYPLKSTIEFGKYTLVPSEKRDEQGWECKLKFTVEEIDKDYSLTEATIEAKIVAAWLSLVFNILIRLKSFSEITTAPKPITNFETIERPDLRPRKHSFGEEIRIPHDFMELWNNFCSLPSEIREGFISCCLCYQVAMEMRNTHNPLSYQLFITAVDFIAAKVVKEKPTKRFVDFICKNLKQYDKEFINKLRGFYGRRSAILHEKGIGLGFIPSFGIESFEEIPHEELWELEIIVNAALIDFLKNPEGCALIDCSKIQQIK